MKVLDTLLYHREFSFGFCTVSFYTGLILMDYAPNAGRTFDTLNFLFENAASAFQAYINCLTPPTGRISVGFGYQYPMIQLPHGARCIVQHAAGQLLVGFGFDSYSLY